MFLPIKDADFGDEMVGRIGILYPIEAHRSYVLG